jgi:hypothetical protein
MIWKAMYLFRRWYIWIRFGTIVEIPRDWIEHQICEIEFRSGRTGEVIGYWAYGHYDPSLPYRG